MARNAEGSHGTHATLSHATRSEILTYLKDKGYACAGQIAEDLGIANSMLSGRLTITKPRDCSSRANLATIEDLIVSLQTQ
ncbi:ArsR family transcriptional regulator [Arachnia propionica]|uniref:ArsR family transcriptional regulator n=1 Tax=Arachnia propionica TaxID=1750 RepID=UPI0030D34A43